MRYEPHTFAIETWRLFLTAHKKMTEEIAETFEQRRVIPYTWYDVLVALVAAPNQQLRLNELAEHLLISRSGLTRLLDRLETQGLLIRQNCAEDKRGTYAVLTKAGKDALKEAWPLYARYIEENFTSILSQDELGTLNRIFQKLLTRHSPAE